jgi:hypothetical protein
LHTCTLGSRATTGGGAGVPLALASPAASWAAIALRSGYLPPVGVIQAVDQYGVRLTHIDLLVGLPSGWDVFVSWGEVLRMEIPAVPAHEDPSGAST